MHSILKRWNNEYFHGCLSIKALNYLEQLDFSNHELVNFLDNHFGWLYLSGFDPYDFSPQAAKWYSTGTEKYLPSTTKIIPPVTIKDRLAEIDDDVLSFFINADDLQHYMLDIGCGYPPYTTLEFANKSPKSFIDAIDPNFPAFILFDHSRENAACFNENMDFVFMQGSSFKLREEKKEEISKELTTEWSKIKLILGTDDSHVNNLIKMRRLIINPMTEYASSRVNFYPVSFENLKLDKVYNLIRCFNVLMYYDRDFYKNILSKIKKTLKHDGKFIHGCVDPVHALQFHYTVIEKQHNNLINKDLVFSINHISPIVYTYAWLFHDDNPDTLLLVNLLKLISSDQKFYSLYKNRYDDFLEREGLAFRDTQGYRIVSPKMHSLGAKSKLHYIYKSMTKEFSDQLILILKRHGVKSTINDVGHVYINIQSLPDEYGKLIQ